MENKNLNGTELNEEKVVVTVATDNVEVIKSEVETMETFNVVEELTTVGYTETGVKSQKTTLLKKVMNTTMTEEVQDIEEISKDELVAMLGIVMNRKSGRAELKTNAKARLEELGVDVAKLVETVKATKKKVPNCKDLKVLIERLTVRIEALEKENKELRK